MVPLGMKANLTQGESLKVVPFGAAPGVSEGAAKMDVPTEGWSAPAYIAHGNADPLVRFEDAANYAAKLCANDVVVTLDIYDGAGHSGPVNQGFDNFSKWVAARFAGEPAQDNCTLIDEVTQ